MIVVVNKNRAKLVLFLFIKILKYDNITAYYHNHRYYRCCSYTIDFDIVHIEIKILEIYTIEFGIKLIISK